MYIQYFDSIQCVIYVLSVNNYVKKIIKSICINIGMKLTNESQKMMSFFTEHSCLLPVKQTIKTDKILTKLYIKLSNGFTYVQYLKTTLGKSFYKLKIVYITHVNQIPKPSTFHPNSFPTEIIKHIEDYSLSVLTYSFRLFDRNINILFVTEYGKTEKQIEIYNNYVDYMLVWLYIVNTYDSKGCSPELTIYIYHTSLSKKLPLSNVNILDENNVNTAFTRTCPKDSEIVVFRKEEWFKAFIHETFHNFGLDFSDMYTQTCNLKILTIFKVNSEVNLFESYTEFWARLINVLFCSYIHMNNKNDAEEFLTNAKLYINIERVYGFFQMVKVLNFMDMSYKNLYENTIHSENIRKTRYKEDTHVLSYFIICLILFNNYQDFLLWCETNNTLLLQFKQTKLNLNNFCNFIGKKYKTKSMIDGINCTEKLLQQITQAIKKEKGLDYLLRNLRMTICELG